MFGNALYQLSVIRCSFFWRFVSTRLILKVIHTYLLYCIVVRFSTIAVDI